MLRNHIYPPAYLINLFNRGVRYLYFFSVEEYEDSYNAYESALHWLAEEPISQSDLLVALASMAYMVQGPDDAKTLLFQR